jgi:multicomponent K+:H+ antiporter subunit F
VILSTALPWLVAVFVIALLLAAYRLLRGPGLADRILALDTLYVISCALLVLLGIYFDTELYFEAALLIGMLGFVGTVVMSKFVLRGNIVE